MLLHAPRPARTRSAPPRPRWGSTTCPSSPAASPSRCAPEPTTSSSTRDQRWYRRLYADPFVDVWLISWAVEQATELHDHAGSLGALTVVSGELQEQRWVPAERGLRTRRLRAGKGATFALGHVHDVVNSEPRHAVSVHAYSPPLTAIRTTPWTRRATCGVPARCSPRESHAAVTTVGELLAPRAPGWTGSPRRAHAELAGGVRCWSTPGRSGSARTRARCPGRWLIERNHLEWRLDPASDARIPEATDHDVTWILVCSEGYSSSLAAASLQDLGLRNATDLDGGFRAWKAAGLPVG